MSPEGDHMTLMLADHNSVLVPGLESEHVPEMEYTGVQEARDMEVDVLQNLRVVDAQPDPKAYPGRPPETPIKADTQGDAASQRNWSSWIYRWSGRMTRQPKKRWGCGALTISQVALWTKDPPRGNTAGHVVLFVHARGPCPDAMAETMDSMGSPLWWPCGLKTPQGAHGRASLAFAHDGVAWRCTVAEAVHGVLGVTSWVALWNEVRWLCCSNTWTMWCATKVLARKHPPFVPKNQFPYPGFWNC